MRHLAAAALVLLVGAQVASAATLVRGPYLQLLTTHSVTVVWTTDVPATCALDVGLPGATPTTIPGAVDVVTSACVVAVDGLSPGTHYAYVPRADGVALTAASEFHTDDPTVATTLLAFGDSGDLSPEQLAVRDRMVATPADAILHTGDMVYDNGALADFDTKFFTPYSDLVRRMMLWPSLGNHDIRTLNGQPWRDVFYTPANNPNQNEGYYSFDVGNAHVVVLNSNGAMGAGAAQPAFLDAEMAATTATWKIVVFHHTIYSSGINHGSNLPIRGSLTPIFDARGVDLVLMGHEHNYERTYPMVANQIVGPNQGTVYVTTGGGGRDLYPVFSSFFTAYSESVAHFVRITLDGGVMNLQMVDSDGTVHDSTSIVKGAPFTTTTTSTSTSSSTSSSAPTSTSTSTTSTSTSSSTSTSLPGQTTTTSTSHTTSSTTSSSTTTSSSSSTTSTTHINVTTSSTTTTTHPVSTTTSSSSSTTSTAPGATTSSSSTSSTSTSSTTSTTSTSTSTSTSSSTTTETTASTTTTLPAPLCTDSSCADTDPCTIDSCDPVNGCRHDPIDIGAVMASIETSLVVDTCAGQVIPRGLSGSIARARERIQSSAVAGPRLAHRLMLTGIRRLHVASHRADVARRQGRLSAGCTEVMRGRLDAAANQAGCL